MMMSSSQNYRLFILCALVLQLTGRLQAINIPISHDALSPAAAPPVATTLRCAYLVSPIGIDVPSPRLSWLLSHPDRGQKQIAYQVQVSTASDFSKLVWDSGQQNSANFYTTYGSVGTATALKSDTSYYWRVRWWDSTQTSSSWASSNFDTGLLAQSDWLGKWIGGAGNILRKVISIPGHPGRARAFISGIGYYELYVNGQRVGDARLDPGWTTYGKRVLYNVYDVTSLLTNGDNAIGVMLGHGWYSSTEAREPNGPLSLIFQLSVDGKVLALSDETWQITLGPVVYDGIYNGETYDARIEQAGWDTPTFQPVKAWSASTYVKAPGGVLSYQSIPPVRVTKVINPINMTRPTPGSYVFDFGQNFSGWCKLSITGPAGGNVTLRHAEILQHSGNGQLYTDNLRSARATDVYILKGDKSGEVYEPRFTYHGFRYVELSSSFGFVPTLTTLVGHHAHTDVGQTGSIQFEASSNILNMIQHNIIWGQESNIMSIPTDCDQRDERKGWMGDAQLSGEEALHNFYMPALYTHFLRLIRDEQGPDGSLTDTVPWTFGGRPADPAWGSAYPSLVYWLWKYHNDIEVAKDHYNALKLYIDFLTAQVSKTGLGNIYFNYGDWVPPPPAPACSAHVTSAFSYIANLRQFIEIAQAVGNNADATKYSGLLPNLVAQFNTAFLHTSSNTYDNGVQTALTLPLWLYIVPDANKASVINNLLNDIVSAHNTHLTTGIIGVKYLMELLHWLDRDDIALQLAENIDYPSWGYMAVNPIEPATTVWELWNAPDEGPGMNSRSHIMYGSVSDWFYKALAGISYGSTNHFDSITIAPAIVGDLKSVYALFETGQGIVTSEFTLSGEDTVCGTGAEGQQTVVDCGSIHSESVITDIKFASYGLPFGQCGYYAEDVNCSAAGVHEYVRQLCIGKTACTLMATHHQFGVEKPCTDFSRLYVEAVCSRPPTAAGPGYTLSVAIPVGATAQIEFPKLDLSGISISESGTAVWQSGSYRAGVAGITGASSVGTSVIVKAGSGVYHFTLSGTQGTAVCGTAAEAGKVNLSCPSAGQTITNVRFASFGTPTGSCGSFKPGKCNAGSSLTVVKDLCLNKASCSITVEDTVFGDPCFNTVKTFAVEVVCSS